MKIAVDNEVGELEAVLVHRPGDEIQRMTQHQLETLLFDDILSPTETVREHELLVDILRGGGATVYHLTELLEQALNRAPTGAVEQLLSDVAEQAGVPWLAKIMSSWSPARMGQALICGVGSDELDEQPVTLASLRSATLQPHPTVLSPLPNLMFMRDPCFSMYDRFAVGRMKSKARWRESLLVAFALRWCEGPEQQTPLIFDERDAHRALIFRQLEGGDVQVWSPQVVAIGCSLRTSSQTIERFADEALFPTFPELSRVYVLLMPAARSVMHLDTILTQIDRTLFLGHQPMIEGNAQRDPLRVALIERGRGSRILKGSMLDVLRDELGAELSLVSCGGEQLLHQEREQWTDGANSVCVAPGRILLYARNVETIRALREYDFEEVRLHVGQSPSERQDLIQGGMTRSRTVFSFSGSELSRARGGGHCLTMPLRRASL